MGLYKNFKIASYAHAQYLVSAAEEDIVRQIDYFDAYLGGLDKILSGAVPGRTQAFRREG